MPRVLFTSETARQMQERSTIAKNAIREAGKVAISVPLTIKDRYSAVRLARTRKQIEMLSMRIEQELCGDCDAQKLDRLSSAMGRLSVIEQQLSGRPLPGTLQPGREKPARLMLSPAVDAGHAQSLATPTQPSAPAGPQPSDVPPAENS